MLRMLSVLIVALGLLLATPTLEAQTQQRAYAPEDLRSLSRDDQVRVISLEYSEQARGRRIADDQLRFYLDQVNRSDWNFSRIKQDIAISLGGSNGGWNPGPVPPTHPGNSVLCESDKNRRRECTTGFRGNAVISRQLSSARCVEGQNWGQRRGTVWVSNGCRAEFTEGGDAWNPGPGGGVYSVTCSSAKGRRASCAWDPRYGTPVLIQQLSSDTCREGQSWGYQGNQLWVDRGCRARFGARR